VPVREFSGVKRLTGERLVLEPVTKLNAATLWRVMQSNGLREFQDVPRHTREEFERRVAARPKQFSARAVGRFEWLLVIAASRCPIGWVSLRVGEPGRRAAELGYSIIAPQRGFGYASEAVRLVVSHAFETADLQRVEACCVPANMPSRRLLENLGFVEMRVQRHGAIVRGRPVDIVLFDMPRERWPASAGVYGACGDEVAMSRSANAR